MDLREQENNSLTNGWLVQLRRQFRRQIEPTIDFIIDKVNT